MNTQAQQRMQAERAEQAELARQAREINFRKAAAEAEAIKAQAEAEKARDYADLLAKIDSVAFEQALQAIETKSGGVPPIYHREVMDHANRMARLADAMERAMAEQGIAHDYL